MKFFGQQRKWLLIVVAAYVLFAVGASVGQILKAKPADPFSRYNNYLIFKYAYEHLKNGKNLYVAHPDDHYDLYKYSPTFAVLFAPFGLLNDHAGFILWNLLNSLAFLGAIMLLPWKQEFKKIYFLLFVLIELMTNMQNAQSNGLIAALLTGAFAAFEKNRNMTAALLIVLSAYIKIFGLLMAVLFMIYPKRRQFMTGFLLWSAVLFLIPMLFISPEGYLMQLKGWVDLLKSDHSASFGISVFGIIHSWFGTEPAKGIILIAGLVFLLLPLLGIRHFISYEYRLFYFASLLIWLVIFNHKAESPTFIIAVTGVGLWFFQKSQTSLSDKILSGLVFLLTILSPTDLFPKMIREEWVVPYSLKALPCLLVYIKIYFDLIRRLRTGPAIE